FVEFADDDSTTVFDLTTVRHIQPARFSIVSTETDLPDVMKFALNAFDILQPFCKRPDGNYPAPQKLLALGKPDLPVEKIEVKRDSVIWFYPYKRFAYGKDAKPVFIICRGDGKTEPQWFLEQRAKITNGRTTKHVFDCQRGLSGLFFSDSDDPAKV